MKKEKRGWKGATAGRQGSEYKERKRGEKEKSVATEKKNYALCVSSKTNNNGMS
jgi:hypothetical protein